MFDRISSFCVCARMLCLNSPYVITYRICVDGLPLTKSLCSNVFFSQEKLLWLLNSVDRKDIQTKRGLHVITYLVSVTVHPSPFPCILVYYLGATAMATPFGRQRAHMNPIPLQEDRYRCVEIPPYIVSVIVHSSLYPGVMFDSSGATAVVTELGG